MVNSDNIVAIQWIKDKLLENNMDSTLLYALFDEFVSVLGHGITRKSYVDKIQRIKKAMILSEEDKKFSQAIDKKVAEVSLRQENRILRMENNHLLSRESKNEKYLELIQKAVQEYEPFEAPIFTDPDSDDDKEAILFLSDLHFGEIVTKEDTLHKNEYNTMIAQRRIDRVFSETIRNCQELEINRITILLGGDLISGIIQEETLRNSDCTIVSAILSLADYLAQSIRGLTLFFKKINIVSTIGNHGRILTGKPFYAEYAENNFETILLEFIRRELCKITDSFIMPEGIFSIFDIFGRKYCLTHGHIFKGGDGFSTIPNTIPRDTAKITGFLPENVEAFFIGHFHVPFVSNSFVNNIPVYCNGTLMGATAFSVDNFKMITPPIQTFFVVTKNKGIKYYSEIRCE